MKKGYNGFVPTKDGPIFSLTIRTMFDRTTINQGPKEVYQSSKVEVHEHRAPTDESIRIHSEMLEKAKSEFAGAFKVQSNVFNCSAVAFQNQLEFKKEIFFQYSINGNKYEFRYEMNPFQSISECAKDSHEKLLRNIANNILFSSTEYSDAMGRIFSAEQAQGRML